MNRFLKISRCLAAAGALLLVFAFFVKAEVRTAAGFPAGTGGVEYHKKPP
jgi:membrane protein DedA with SNARE-associated domain